MDIRYCDYKRQAGTVKRPCFDGDAFCDPAVYVTLVRVVCDGTPIEEITARFRNPSAGLPGFTKWTGVC